MPRSVLLPLALTVGMALSLLGCPKKPQTSVAGTDEERLDAYASRLEELRSRGLAGELQCPEWCTAREEVCHISQDTCDISTRLSERTEVTHRCVSAQEECARFSDECGRCG